MTIHQPNSQRGLGGVLPRCCPGQTRVNLSRNSKLYSLKKKKKIYFTWSWAYVDSSHGQISRNVWGGKLYSSWSAWGDPCGPPTVTFCIPAPHWVPHD